MKKGFTLVELSIVLIIIGLLISGILIAQSMINTTRIQSLARQIGQYDAAVANFTTKYNTMPGDNISVSGGNGNYLIESANGTDYDGEVTEFWPSLSLSYLKSEEDPVGGYTSTITYNNAFPYDGPNAPKSKAGVNAGILVKGEQDAGIFTPGVGNINMYVIANCSGMTTVTLSCINAFTGPDAIAVDQKLDDGDATTGEVRGMKSTGTAIATWAGMVGAAPAAYVPEDIVSATEGSMLFIKIGSVTGTQD